MTSDPLKYRRILLKVSGEALMGEGTHGINPELIAAYAGAIKRVADQGCQIAMVIGGGNIFRGAGLVEAGIERVTGDQMGMLATAINALAMQATLEKVGAKAKVMSAFPIGSMVEAFSHRRAKALLEAGEIVLFTGGTGNPFFTTDTAASLRAIEIDADIMLKATKVDGVYDADPKTHPEAKRYDELSYDEVVAQDLKVMDATAVILCRDHDMPLCVFDINADGALDGIVKGKNIGTRVVRGGCA